MPDLIFKEQEITQLITFVNDNLPTKFGRPILDFVEKIANSREAEAKEAEKPEKEIEKK